MHRIDFSILAALLLLVLASALGGCSAPRTRVINTPETRELPSWEKPYEVNGKRYQPLLDHHGFQQQGIASWYGNQFHGHKTSNGEIYNMYAMTAAHKTLPLGVYVRVTDLANSRSVVVRINDRGPFVSGRIIDLSYAAAQKLGMAEAGTAPVRIEALGYRQVAQGQVRYQAPANYDAGTFAVQIGAFSVIDNARRLSAQMRARFGKAEIQTATVNGSYLYRVRVGVYHSLERAEQAAREFKSTGFPGSFVVAFD